MYRCTKRSGRKNSLPACVLRLLICESQETLFHGSLIESQWLEDTLGWLTSHCEDV